MIVGVAVRLADGEVRSLPKPARHCHLFAEYNETSRARGWDSPWAGWPSEEVRHGEQGFVDDEGRFLSRAEAAAHAFACGQIPAPRLGLFSEDVW